ncbi:MAG: Gfo/Idh/MocA family oxidoreductase [Deltaproteobacteria bacterium]|nr:Gfo/Idh/MocA family oxidoreductase [bacterium]MCB9476737.1 Gfo/Idh/MocA family oxidoreductase [Deltaproteobacteria bacterium]MCB9487448.1 Gfo/Idh/MocA family oxidoreductase [Deltaproteobacteria bacterium]
MPPTKVGIVGVGHMGKYHVGAYSEIMNVEIVGLVDQDEEKLAFARDIVKLPVFTDYRELFGKVDAVSIAVPTRHHFAVVKDFLEAGVHVLVEKPIAPKYEQALELFQIAEKHDLELHIGHVERFNAAVGEIKKIIADPFLIESRRIGPYSARINDAGVVLDLLIHDIDIVQNLMDRPVKRFHVMGRRVVSDFEDLVNLQLEFEGGCVANLIASRVSELKARTLSVSQKGMYIALDYTDQEIDIHRQSSSSYQLGPNQLKYRQESVIERIFVHKQNPLKLELEHFLACAHGLTERMTTVEHDLSSLRVAIDVLDALRAEGISPAATE